VFHDRARIEVLAGRGGDGGLSFRREKHVPKGGPDGGDGGRGGDVILAANPALRDLSAFRARKRFRAGRGEPGRGARKHGADGATIVLEVPVGTQAYGVEGELVADLARPDARVVLARGGQGGRGNSRFATAVRQTPRFAEVGDPPGEAEIELRLKLLADAALAGLPNAGKSSLLRRLSNAKPKVAEYPFTTLAPVLGTVESPDGAQLTVADVPGLIEGASQGLGLGHEFLAHLERARLLLHVIDASEGDVEERYRTIDRELALYGAGLDERPQALVLNKIDLLPDVPEPKLDDPRIVRTFRVSAATGEGIEELKRTLFTLVPSAPPAAAEEPSQLPEFLEYRPHPPARRRYRIYRTDRGYRIAGEAPTGEELEAALRSAGIRTGQEVEIGEDSFEWE
jgi:GTP-binding protein